MGNFMSCPDLECKRAIVRTYHLRMQRFDQAKKKVTAYGQTEAEREHIHSLSLLELRDALQSGQFLPSQVLYAYAYYALEAQDQLNCIAEFLLEAFDEAEQLDTMYNGQGAEQPKKPPLYGLPFSVKANFFLKGYDCCIGNARWLDKPCTTECTFITFLRQQGAIPFCYTNVPQTLISFCCSNPVYGTTGNPYNPQRTPGGSSGGEAALLAAHGTAFATGGDIGGSLRIPAHCCGVCALKPGQKRFEIWNAHSGVPGHGRLGLGTAPLARTMDELIFLLTHILGNVDYTRLVPHSAPVPLDVDKINWLLQKGRILRIGYHFNDGFIKPVPACGRAVSRCVELLRAESHELVHFSIPQPHKAAGLFFTNMMPEGGAYFRKTFAENPVDVYMKKFSWMLMVPLCIRWLLAYVLELLQLSPQLVTVLRSGVRTPMDVSQVQADLDEYVQMFTEEWQANGLDALLVPAFPVPAVPFATTTDLNPSAFATGLYNMLDFPAGVVPAGQVTPEDDHALEDEREWSTESNILLNQMRAAAANSAGLPVGVQVVTLPWQEEKCLAVMKQLEQLLAKQDKQQPEEGNDEAAGGGDGEQLEQQQEPEEEEAGEANEQQGQNDAVVVEAAF